MLAKAALLSGPDRAPDWLAHGGLFVRDDGSYEVVEPAGEETAPPVAPRPVVVRLASHERMSDKHRVALGLVQDLVEKAVVGLERLVGGTDPLGEHLTARRRA